MPSTSARPQRADAPAILWHGTGCLGAVGILGEDRILAYGWDGHGVGVSFTAEREAAGYFAMRADVERAARDAHAALHGPDADFEYDSGRAEAEYPHLGGVVMEFDTAALGDGHAFRRVLYTGDWDDEAEWRLHGASGVGGVASALLAIHVDEASVLWWIERSQVDVADALRRLLVHPAVRPVGDAHVPAGP